MYIDVTCNINIDVKIYYWFSMIYLKETQISTKQFFNSWLDSWFKFIKFKFIWYETIVDFCLLSVLCFLSLVLGIVNNYI